MMGSKGTEAGSIKSTPRLTVWFIHLCVIISPVPESTFIFFWVIGSLGGGGSGALSQETRIIAQRPPLTSCLILNKSLCLSRFIFLICQVKWRLWNRWSLKILPALQSYSGSVCTCKQWWEGRQAGHWREADLGKRTKRFHLEQPCFLMCVVQFRLVSDFPNNWLTPRLSLSVDTHFSSSRSSSCFSEISSPGLLSSTVSCHGFSGWMPTEF